MTIFEYIDVVLHKKKAISFVCELGDQFSGFMLNRWISMCSNTHALVINETTNKYLTTIGTRDDQYEFMHAVIPQGKKQRINYIKKVKEEKKKEEDIDIIALIAKKYEISKREAAELLKMP
jgi:hypothetical protein